ncbi:Cupredoxin [Mycena epipterygia]|nr:Cupredoxin [Mycena epipterygia]
MRFSLALVALVPVLSAYADNILIQVGANNLLAFSPPNITAKVGDVIAFQFQSKNHSVTQSTFATPCSIQTTPQPGLNSQFQPVTPGATMQPQFSFNVTDTTPLWFFCAQTIPANHCNAGMVFSVNADPSSAKSFAVFQAAAMGNATGAASSAGTVASITSDIGSAISGATSAAPSVIAEATSDAAGAVNTATSAIAGAAGAAASDAAKAANGLLGAGVRVNSNGMSLLAVVVIASWMLV